MLEQDPSHHLSMVSGVWGGSYWQKVKQCYSILGEGCEGRPGKLNKGGNRALASSPGSLFQGPPSRLGTDSSRQVWTSLRDTALSHSYACCHWIPGRTQHLPLHFPSSEAVVSNEVTAWPPSLQVPWPLPTVPAFQSHHQLCYLLLAHSKTFTSFLNCGVQFIGLLSCTMFP